MEEELQRLLQREHHYCSYDPSAKFVRHRGVLFEWMGQVQRGFDFSDETLFLSMNYLDRILGEYSICKPQWQLVAMVCVMIAGMYLLACSFT